MYYTPVISRVYFFFTKNSYYTFSIISGLSPVRFRTDHINIDLREKWEEDRNQTRLAPDILGGWDN